MSIGYTYSHFYPISDELMLRVYNYNRDLLYQMWSRSPRVPLPSFFSIFSLVYLGYVLFSDDDAKCSDPIECDSIAPTI